MKPQTATHVIRFLVTLFCLILLLIASFLVVASQNTPTTGSLTPPSERPTILLDAGHGGFDGGALAPDNKPEANFNLTFCRILKPILEKYGFKVTLTRRDDSGLEDASAKTVREKKRSDMHKRLTMMSETPNCIFISIHQNKSPYTSAHGSVVYYSPNHPESETLAAALQSAFITHLQPTNKRTIIQAGSNLFLLHNAPCPAVLVECGFLSNAEEYARLQDLSYQKAFCLVLAHTLAETYPALLGNKEASLYDEAEK